MSTVITVENLGKRYSLHHQQREQYTALRDVINNGVKNLGKKLFSPFTTHHSPFTDSEDFWALKDVSFEVKQGDRIGIIGRNGAGKSTLLKILSRISEPTTGSVRIKGRVASLLEVGTGFHPELTGRENIFLNGAILGMGRAEIKKKFDEIVDFAEIEKFLDTPVKRYSSGMYVRLAFAVAAHLEPEILIVDEVLAVGDAQFQKKCLGKMEDVSAKEGRTVLFVSHNLQAVRVLCKRGILLSQGIRIADDLAGEVISVYNEQIRQVGFGSATEVGNEKNRRGSGAVRFTNISVENTQGKETSTYSIGETICFRLSYKVFSPINHLLTSVVLRCAKTREIVTSARHIVSDTPLLPGDDGEVIIEIDNVNLRPREYPLYLWLGDKQFQPYDVVDDVVAPLTITTEKSDEELGYKLVDVHGYFDVESRIIINRGYHAE